MYDHSSQSWTKTRRPPERDAIRSARPPQGGPSSRARAAGNQPPTVVPRWNGGDRPDLEAVSRPPTRSPATLDPRVGSTLEPSEPRSAPASAPPAAGDCAAPRASPGWRRRWAGASASPLILDRWGRAGRRRGAQGDARLRVGRRRQTGNRGSNPRQAPIPIPPRTPRSAAPKTSAGPPPFVVRGAAEPAVRANLPRRFGSPAVTSRSEPPTSGPALAASFDLPGGGSRATARISGAASGAPEPRYSSVPATSSAGLSGRRKIPQPSKSADTGFLRHPESPPIAGRAGNGAEPRQHHPPPSRCRIPAQTNGRRQR